LLDLDAGWIRFYRIGRQCGPGFAEGVTGPPLRAGQLYPKSCLTKVLPTAMWPYEYSDSVPDQLLHPATTAHPKSLGRSMWSGGGRVRCRVIRVDFKKYMAGKEILVPAAALRDYVYHCCLRVMGLRGAACAADSAHSHLHTDPNRPVAYRDAAGAPARARACLDLRLRWPALDVDAGHVLRPSRRRRTVRVKYVGRLRIGSRT
jgi:hypothetical protein